MRGLLDKHKPYAAMLRISELKLPLDHAPDALDTLIARTLDVPLDAIASHTVYKRSFDARKVELLTVYIRDVQLADAKLEAALLAKHAGHPHIQAAPDMRYTPPANAAEGTARPVVIGFGPCGIFAALMLAKMGFKPIVLEARQDRAPAHPRHLGPVAQERAQPRVERAVRRRRRRHLLRRQALQPDQGPALPRPQGDGRVREGRRAARNPLRRASAHRHLQAGEGGREHPRADRGAGRRDPLRAARDRRAHRGDGRHLRGLTVLDQRPASERAARRPRGDGARPQLARHLRDAARRAACTSRPSPSRSASASSTRRA